MLPLLIPHRRMLKLETANEMDVEMAGVRRQKLVMNARRVAAVGKAAEWNLLGMEEARK